jgi:hypothetical protein
MQWLLRTKLGRILLGVKILVTLYEQALAWERHSEDARQLVRWWGVPFISSKVLADESGWTPSMSAVAAKSIRRLERRGLVVRVKIRLGATAAGRHVPLSYHAIGRPRLPTRNQERLGRGRGDRLRNTRWGERGLDPKDSVVRSSDRSHRPSRRQPERGRRGCLWRTPRHLSTGASTSGTRPDDRRSVLDDLSHRSQRPLVRAWYIRRGYREGFNRPRTKSVSPTLTSDGGNHGPPSTNESSNPHLPKHRRRSCFLG